VTDLDKEMEEYLKGDTIFDPTETERRAKEASSRGGRSWGRGSGGAPPQDWDDPTASDPFSHGAAGGRMILNYDDDLPSGGGLDLL
jgi:hypothetical protein